MSTVKRKIVWLCLAILLASVLSLTGWEERKASAATNRFTVTVSSNLADENYNSDYLTDGNLQTSWFAQWSNVEDPACDEWVLLDFGEVCKINSITLFQHKDGTSFPQDFSIQWSVRGELYEDIPGFSLTGYSVIGSTGEEFRIRTVTRFLRLKITKRTANPEGNYMLAFAEIEADVTTATSEEIAEAERKDSEFARRPVVDDPLISATVTASSENRPLEDWGAANLTDGSSSTQWCAEWGSGVDDETCDEWIILTFALPQNVTGMIVESQTVEHYGFPKAFSFEWSLDGENFFPITDATYSDESKSNRIHVKVFSSPVVATSIRMSITSSYADTQGNYIPQMAELSAHGKTATEDEVAAATELFSKLIGESQTETEKVYGNGYGTEAAIMLAFGLVFLGGTIILILLIQKTGKTKEQSSRGREK